MDLRIKILVLDDFMTMRKIVKNSLNQIGFENIDEAEDGAKGLTKIQLNGYGLIVSDWNMPKMTGMELLKAIRNSNGSYKDIPFLMVTAEAEKESVVQAIQAGVSNYIIKPFTAEALEAKLVKIFENK